MWRHFRRKCSQRPVLFAAVVLVVLVALSVFVANMVSMLFSNAGDWNASGAGGTWAGALVALVGFVFVFLQLTRETREIQNQTKWQVYSNGLTTLNVFVDHPELRCYFYGDEFPVPEDPVLKDQVFAAAEMLADHWESTMLSDDALNSEVDALWRIYMLGIYCRSPALREFLKNENEGYRYSDKFKNMFENFDCLKIKQFKAGGINARKLLSGGV